MKIIVDTHNMMTRRNQYNVLGKENSHPFNSHGLFLFFNLFYILLIF